jgi:regulator of replication initiation timing
MELESRLRRLEKENRKLRRENAELRSRVSEVLERNTHLETENQHLREENKNLKEELQKLKLELFGLKKSRKTKKKADDDHPESKPKKLGPPRAHKGTSRRKPERIDRKVVLKLESCPHCDGSITPLKPRYRYSEDLVPVTLVATEYEINQYYCKTCKKTVYPEVPELIDNCHFGIRFLLYITYLRYVMNLPYNKMAKLLNDTYDAGVSEGTLISYIKKAAEIFGPEYRRIKRQMKEMDVCHYDDTGQRIDGDNRWLWVFINKEAVLYHTSKSRSKKVVMEILGEDYDGVTVQDFYPSYDGAPGRKQKCWSHLIKPARELAEKKQPPPMAEELYQGFQKIYHDAKECEKGLRTKRQRKKAHRRFVKRLKAFAKRSCWQHCDVKRLANRALKYRKELFTFLLVPGVEPTNNPAERALRPPVRQRKISGCHRTWEGALNRDILMSVMGTMALQGEDFLEAGKDYVLNSLAEET